MQNLDGIEKTMLISFTASIHTPLVLECRSFGKFSFLSTHFNDALVSLCCSYNIHNFHLISPHAISCFQHQGGNEGEKVKGKKETAQLFFSKLKTSMEVFDHNFVADIVEVLLQHDPELCKTVAQANATPLISAAIRGHVDVVNQLLSEDSSSLEISKSNGKNALHFAARRGHLEIVKALLEKDPQMGRTTDKKGQTALHVAVKGLNCPVVKCLLQADPGISMFPDTMGNTALHIATRKKRAEV